MSDQNKRILTQANAFVEKGDYEQFLSYCTDDTEWTFVGDRTLRGKQDVRQYMNATYIEPPQFTVTRLIGEGDFVTALGDISIKDGTGKVVRSAYCDVWRFRGGQIAELNAFVVEIKQDA